jgi:hypothetical protein
MLRCKYVRSSITTISAYLCDWIVFASIAPVTVVAKEDTSTDRAHDKKQKLKQSNNGTNETNLTEHTHAYTHTLCHTHALTHTRSRTHTLSLTHTNTIQINLPGICRIRHPKRKNREGTFLLELLGIFFFRQEEDQTRERPAAGVRECQIKGSPAESSSCQRP